MTPETVPCDNDVTVTVTRPLQHLCPFKDETDNGTITIHWAADGASFELHSLAAYLDAFATSQMSHESITDRIRHDLSSTPGVTCVSVRTNWPTAGFTVQVGVGS